MQTGSSDRSFCCYWQAKFIVYIASLCLQLVITVVNWYNYTSFHDMTRNDTTAVVYFIICVVGVVCSIFELINCFIHLALMCDHHVSIFKTGASLFQDFLKVYFTMDRVTDSIYILEILLQDIPVMVIYVYANTVSYCTLFTQHGQVVVILIAVCSILRVGLLSLRHCCCTMDDIDLETASGLCGSCGKSNGMICSYYRIVPVFYKLQLVFYMVAVMLLVAMFFAAVNAFINTSCEDFTRTTPPTRIKNNTDVVFTENITSDAIQVMSSTKKPISTTTQFYP